jgi:hypothetical protein
MGRKTHPKWKPKMNAFWVRCRGRVGMQEERDRERERDIGLGKKHDI